MIIRILGTGCPNCQKLEDNTKKALKELGIEARVEKVTDIQEIMSYGILSMPALLVDEKVLSYGTVPAIGEIKKILSEKSSLMADNRTKKCSCAGGCC